MATAILNAARLRELISYDQSTGVFTNRINCGLHETPELASEAYKLAKQKYHPMAVF